MDLRSSRSRSRTPFIQTKLEEEVITNNEENQIIEETVVKHSYSTRNKTIKSNNSVISDDVFESPAKQKSQRIVTRSRHKTSDYSSEEGENEISSSKGNGYPYTRSQASAEKTLSKNGELRSALQLYKEAGEYWNKYPKTDYTYSIHSKDRVEVAPGVVAMPNMSRRSLRRSTESASSIPANYCQLQSTYYSDQVERLNRKTDNIYDHNTNLAPKNLFRDDVDSEYERYEKVTEVTVIRRIYRSITSVFTRIWTSILMILTIVSQNSIKPVLWIGRGYYKAVSRLLLFDTWLLQSSSGTRRWGPLIALMLLPLLIFTGWWLWSGLSHALQGAFLFPPTPYHEASTEEIINFIPEEEQLAKIIITPADSIKEQIKINDIVKLLLDNPEFEKIITKHINSKTSEFDQQQKSFDGLKGEIIDVNQKIDSLAAYVQLENTRNNARLSMELNRCCRRQFIHIESYVKKLLADLIGLPNTNIQPEHISGWLHTIFVAKQDLESRLSNLTQDIHSDLENLVEISATKIMNDVSDKINIKLRERLEINRNSIGIDSALTDSQVHRIVKEALATYDADKTGLVDYALEPSGGQILSTRCTESYNKRTAVLSVLGFPLWYPSNTPRTVITPGVVPGECWAFQNFPGFLVVQLSTYVKISAVSLEHIPKNLAPGGVRDSAPKAFTVWGLQNENDREPWQLGNYVYDLQGPSLQFFQVENEGPAFNMVELRVESNHGNMNYTCLYRFRVHGIMSTEPT